METLDVIRLLPLLGVNHRQYILHMSKIMVHFYSINDSINQFAIGYMINPSLNFNKVFREKVQMFLSVTFNEKTMETIKNCLRKKNRCVMALIMFYENNGIKPKKVYRVFSCFLYSLIKNYVCIHYI